jgi:hypothetical protein
MGFFTGRVTYLRYRVDGVTPGNFGPDHLERLSTHAIGKQLTESKDGTEVGWIAGEDILDVSFDLARNVVQDSLYCAVWVDTQKLPADLIRAYARAELQALAAQNPSGRPSVVHKKQARDSACAKLQAEAKDGRFLRRKAYPVLWDGPSNHLFAGTTSTTVLDRLQKLFKDTFGCGLTLLDAGQRALQQVPGAVDVRPSSFVPGSGPDNIGWNKNPASPCYLGNEFLLWLWFVLETETDTLILGDNSQVTVMLSRMLVLDCPRAVSGNETIRSDCPIKLPEARRAIQAGKLPRQAGMILVRHDQQYELTLQAETLAVSGAKLSPGENGDERVRQEERVGQVRHLIETVDLLYGAFLKRRLAGDWPRDLERMERWLQGEERSRLAVAS